MKTGRNNLCPCGSGKKYKHCCARKPKTPSAPVPRLNVSVKVRKGGGTSPRQRRQCGDCTACCTALIINEPGLVMPARDPCPHLCAGGCSIHDESRPDTCKGYFCNYVLHPGPITVNERPDQAGAIVRVAWDQQMKPPLDRTICVSECASGGLMNVLANRVWGPLIREGLLAGNPILFTWFHDGINQEATNVRFFDGKLGCELASCSPDGSPILETMEPVHDQPIRIALFIPNQDFAFDAEVLIRELGDREFVVLGSSASSGTASGLRFLFTRHQAELFATLLALIGAEQTRPSRETASV